MTELPKNAGLIPMDQGLDTPPDNSGMGQNSSKIRDRIRLLIKTLFQLYLPSALRAVGVVLIVILTSRSVVHLVSFEL